VEAKKLARKPLYKVAPKRGIRKAVALVSVTEPEEFPHGSRLGSCWRHTFASQWMMNSGDLYVLKAILGHKSVAMTQRYAHLSPSDKKAMVERMEQIWAKPTRRAAERPDAYGARRPIPRDNGIIKTAGAIAS
jgi:integrase